MITEEEVDKVLADVECETLGLKRISFEIVDRLINTLKKVKNIAYEPVLADEAQRSKLLKCNCKDPIRYSDGKNILACRRCHNEV